MAQKVTITIPDELSEKLEIVKGNFNVSGICQEAIRREVNRQELLSKENGKMKDVIERLKMEKKEHDTKYKEIGFNDGYEAAKKMHYTELVEFANYNAAESSYQDGKLVATKTAKCWNIRSPELSVAISQNKFLIKVYERFDKEFTTAKQNDGYLNEDDYKGGWANGVKMFWEKAKDKLQLKDKKTKKGGKRK